MPRNATPETQRYAPVGSLVLSGYWGTVDQVLSHNDDGTVTVVGVEHEASRNHNMDHLLGVERTHSTAMGKRDRIVGTAS